MNKKFKYTSLVAAGAVTLGLVGGTLAWWTSSDTVTNTFNTHQSDDNTEDGSGIKIVEDWDGTVNNMTPGTVTNKDVQVKNVDSYNQFVKANLKVKVTKAGKIETKNVILNGDKYVVDGYPEIVLTFTKHLTIDKQLGTWFYNLDTTNNVSESNFYYIGQVAPGSHTNTLLDSVTLESNADYKKYTDLKFEVIVTAHGVQTTNNAANDQWQLGDNHPVKDYYKAKDNGQPAIGVANPIDPLENSEGDNDKHEHSAHVTTQE